MKILWSLILCLCCTMSLSARGYDDLWTQVKQASAKDLPKQALMHVQTIVHKAEQERNDVQLLKAHLALIQFNFEISADSLLPFTHRMEQALGREKRPLQRSLWHSALAQVYESKAYVFSRQGMVYSAVEDTIVSHFEASLLNPELLMAVSYQTFLPLFVDEADSHYFNNDCLHVLYRAYMNSFQIPSTKKKQCIDKVRKVYQRFANHNAVILLTLDALDNSPLQTQVNGRLEDSPYYTELNRIYQSGQQYPASVYVLCRIASLYDSQYTDTHRVSYSLEDHNHNDSTLYVRISQALTNTLYKNEKEGLTYLSSVRSRLTTPSVSISDLYTEYRPSEVVNLTVLNRNVESLTFKVVPIYTDCVVYDKATNEQINHTVRRRRDIARKYEYMPLGTVNRWGRCTVNMRIPDKPGIYALEVLVNNKQVKSHTFHVTNLASLAFTTASDTFRLVVVDRYTGFPVSGAQVSAYDTRSRKLYETYKTTDGEIAWAGTRQPRRLYAHTSTDHASPSWYQHGKYGYTSSLDVPTFSVVDLFTDRSIYRPGQTVYFSGTAYQRQGDEAHVDSMLSGWVTCVDFNDRVIDSLEVHTDAFGVFQGSFKLPEKGMNGTYLLRFVSALSQQNVISFKVEEYVRPTFQVNLTKTNQTYGLNDSVWVEGRAETFTGLPVAHALVTYQLHRSSWWRNQGISLLQTGEVRTDAKGNFRFRIQLEAPVTADQHRAFSCYFFNVNCAVTSANGETITSESVYRVQSQRAFFETHLPQTICRDFLPECTVSLLNASRQQVTDSVCGELWDETQCLWSGKLITGKPFLPHFCASLPSGRYRLLLHGGDDVEDYVHHFSLFAAHDTLMPDTSQVFFTYHHTSAASDSVTAFIATSADEALVYYHLVSGQQVLESRRIPISSRLHRLDLVYRPEYGDGATAFLAMVRHNRLYTYSYRVSKPLPDKRLQLEWSTFRSHLTPGQHEEWRLRITRPDGTPARANLMACLYDASLNSLTYTPWSYSLLDIQRNHAHADWSASQFNGELRYILTGSIVERTWLSIPYPELTHWDAALFDYNVVKRNARLKPSRRGFMTNLLDSKSVSSAAMRSADKVEEVYDTEAVVEEGGGTSDTPLVIRSNFAETAFFQPMLRTDSTGEVSLSFVLPESMTQWQFKALAHDAVMNHGSIEALVQARKDFMVQPALPRFVRRGDRTNIPINVTNLTHETKSLTLKLTVEDGLTEGLILKTFDIKMQLPAEQSQVVYFEFPVNFDAPYVVCRVVGQGEGFSDGEEHMLPVLTDEVEVTRTVPFSLTEAGTTSIKIPNWLQRHKMSHRLLEVELTSNPIWYTLTTLPVLAGRTKSCLTADDWATAYYANALGASLVAEHPEIGQTIAQRSDELRDMLSPRLAQLDDCTPWLSQGANEAQRISQLQRFVQDDQLSLRSQLALNSLAALQQADGGWSWCPGMKSNVWKTLDVSLLLARAAHLTGNQTAQPLLTKAYTYLRRLMKDDVDQMKKREKEHKEPLPITQKHLQYLYLTVLMGEQPHGADFYLLKRTATLRKEFTMYGKAVIAWVLSQTGYPDEAKLALQSLLEHTTITPAQGRFFETSRALSASSTYRIPTQCAAIEALEQMGHRTEAEEMRLWLLQAKRTQMWDTPRASTDAVYTLLSAAKQSVVSSLSLQSPLEFTLYDGPQVVASSTSAEVVAPHAAAYLRQTYTDDTVVNADRLEITKPTEGLSWGAVYATFSQPEHEVVKSGSGFDLTYTVEVFEEGKWKKFRLGKPLHPGMRVRRIYLFKADHDYDFVKLRVDRPACFTPVEPLSRYEWYDHFAAYRMVRDSGTEFFIEHLAKGSYRLTDEYFVDRSGVYATGTSRITCLQAPEYTAVTPSLWLHVE